MPNNTVKTQAQTLQDGSVVWEVVWSQYCGDRRVRFTCPSQREANRLCGALQSTHVVDIQADRI